MPPDEQPPARRRRGGSKGDTVMKTELTLNALTDHERTGI